MRKNLFSHELVVRNPIVENKQFLAKLVDSEEELKKVCRLRYQIFNEEMKIGVSNQNTERYKLDYEIYDKHTAHLIVIEKKSNGIVATYRMQNYKMAMNGIGFCSADRFNFSQFPLEMQRNGLEVSRACILKEYRNTQVFFMLWKGLATVLYENKLRYFFGCGRAADTSKSWQIRSIMEQLKNMNVYHKNIRVKPLPEFRCEYDSNAPLKKNVTLPSLLRLYLRFKCLICSDPCTNWHFKEIEFLLLYDARCVSDKYHRMFLDSRPRIF